MFTYAPLHIFTYSMTFLFYSGQNFISLLMVGCVMLSAHARSTEQLVLSPISAESRAAKVKDVYERVKRQTQSGTTMKGNYILFF